MNSDKRKKEKILNIREIRTHNASASMKRAVHPPAGAQHERAGVQRSRCGRRLEEHEPRVGREGQSGRRGTWGKAPLVCAREVRERASVRREGKNGQSEKK
jgi:hypothetical protein